MGRHSNFSSLRRRLLVTDFSVFCRSISFMLIRSASNYRTSEASIFFHISLSFFRSQFSKRHVTNMCFTAVSSISWFFICEIETRSISWLPIGTPLKSSILGIPLVIPIPSEVKYIHLIRMCHCLFQRRWINLFNLSLDMSIQSFHIVKYLFSRIHCWYLQ